MQQSAVSSRQQSAISTQQSAFSPLTIEKLFPSRSGLSVRVRLTDISNSTPTVEILSYVLTRDFNEFAAVREDLLLRIMDLVQESGTGLALPSQTLYLGRDPGLEKEKADSAVNKVTELREGRQLPFPDFREEDISSFQGSIDYPPTESALRNPSRNSG